MRKSLAQVLRSVVIAVALIYSASFAVVASRGAYELHAGPLTVAAHSLFKSLQQAEGVFLLSLIALAWLVRASSTEAFRASPTEAVKSGTPAALWPLGGSLVLIACLYLPSLWINPLHPEWNLRYVSAGIHSLSGLAKIFVTSPVYGFYRPVPFVSLWFDERVFGDNLWGYHLQSIGLHLANCVLVWRLAGLMGLTSAAAGFSALLFGATAATFEAVIWPTARFDLAAVFFTLLALICTLRYIQEAANRPVLVWRAALFLALGIASKETSYSYILVAPCLIYFLAANRCLCFPRQRLIFLARVCGGAVASMALIRLIIYKGVGGYSQPGQPSVHLHLGWGTITSLTSRLPLCLFGINSTVPLPPWCVAACVLFATTVVLSLVASARGARHHVLLLTCAVLSSVPTLNIIGWVRDSMESGRYLYMPAVWMVLFLAAALEKRDRAPLLMGLFVAANAVGLEHNLHVYRTMLGVSERISARIGADSASLHAPLRIAIAGLPRERNGVLFFDFDLETRIKTRIPGAEVEESTGLESNTCADLRYRWNESGGDVIREAQVTPCTHKESD